MRPEIRLNVVDLPQPVLPRMATNSPRPMVKLKSRTASNAAPPSRRGKDLLTCSKASSGAPSLIAVMRGLDPRIPICGAPHPGYRDCRDKPGNDDGRAHEACSAKAR